MRSQLRLATHTVMVAVEAVRVRWQDEEVTVRYVRAV
jgi:hypothetical protein